MTGKKQQQLEADRNQQQKNHNPNQRHDSKKEALGPNTKR